ncbi:primosomal protein N' [Marinicellulosiphila megalodicopiae]|uniref:primosomal protein N' n=1 Tax=Marinicellulosiphila megalodicopiae TaxID=2724896 RepID=UPI003BAFA8FD
MTLFVEVALPVRVNTPFTYQLSTDEPLDAGTRVLVPFNAKQLVGIVLCCKNEIDFDPKKVKPVTKVLDTTPALSADMLELARWVSQYYHYRLGECLSLMLPKGLRGDNPAQKSTVSVTQLTDKGKLVHPNQLAKKPKQQAWLSQLNSQAAISSKQATSLELSPSSRNTLIKQGLVVKTDLPIPILHNQATDPNALELNTEQQTVLDNIALDAGFQCHLIFGVTGSGKTEVFLQLMQQVLDQNKQVLILVPEISLIDQTIKRLKARFDTTFALLHSGLNDTQRNDAWLDARSGDARIVLGTRSSVFCTLPDLGLIIVDEEHDGAYKQNDTLRYHGRDVAIVRAQKQNIPVVLASATPSLESLHNALNNRFVLHRLTQRAANAQMPFIEMVNLKQHEPVDGISQPLHSRIQQHLEHNKQVLLFLNRRGFAPTVMCTECGWQAVCHQCDARLTLHKNQLICHHCNQSQPILRQCKSCSSHSLTAIGNGTVRSEMYLETHFPNTHIIRLDKDSTQTKDALKTQLEIISNGEPCIIIGTQMLAKGHHFDQVTLVGVLDCDSGLFSADFKGEERTLQLLTQVAGRSGRAKDLGEVLIQTYHPTHPLFQAIENNQYEFYAQQLLDARHDMLLPPFNFSALIQADHQYAYTAESALIALKQIPLPPQVDCIGPMPAFMAKLANRYRFHLVLKSQHRSQLHMAITILQNALQKQSKVRWFIDVDPNEL